MPLPYSLPSRPAPEGCQHTCDPRGAAITLEDGSPATTYCECWRAECARRFEEASAIVRLARVEARRARVNYVADVRGPVAAERLGAEVRRLWAARRAAIMGAAGPVFVFGSNLAGRHGAGAALWARENRGAITGQGEGIQGQSYAIPTKDEQLRPLPLERIRQGVDRFLAFAADHGHLTFELTPIGCGLAGYSPPDIAPMFRAAPPNVQLPREFTAHHETA